MFDQTGSPVRMIGTAQDITERKLLEMEIQMREERYRRLVENSLEAIAIIQDRKFIFINGVGLEMFGVSDMDEIIGQDYLDFLAPSHHEESKIRLAAILSEQPIDPVEFQWRKKNGEVFHAELLGTYIGDNAIKISLRDITERKKTDELLLRSEKLNAVGQLAAGVAHEIRNPLTSLKGFTQMLHAMSKGKEKRYFEIMNAELDRIKMILSEMLVLAKPQSTHFRKSHIKLILHEVITLLSALANMRSVDIQTAFDDNEVAMVLCDENQLKQVFINIIKNAIEAMHSGGILRVHVKTQGNQLCIEFIDQGEGIPEDRIPKVGEPFYTTKEKGTGLGLMVSRKIITAHHGDMEISSKKGHGTTVRVILPVES
ncbi:ATP-binding protein [Alicyclobacillus acidoterrestris]|uniref:histidine kinase n=1 Tax=Alicyclobacillus acidoterrestris (strain ATCC 49025 / DSM 3922 / CIP 106132 / NCIMB 13137 / GD3B) TaxID=1356854 RepID=A0A9E6ZS11_ALIAG|nr:ATP-binding protein [Alicyclobacillus acidoterrestris]UNO48139.1 ATP-binding protein [Alicyclobacillus acidoterrestris]